MDYKKNDLGLQLVGDQGSGECAPRTEANAGVRRAKVRISNAGRTDLAREQKRLVATDLRECAIRLRTLRDPIAIDVAKRLEYAVAWVIRAV